MGVALAVGTLSLVGCGDDADATRDGTTAEDAAVLRIATVEDLPEDGRPISARSPMELLVADLTFDTLTDIEHSTGEVVPGLATSWSSDDGVTWAFTVPVDGPDPAALAASLASLSGSADTLAARRLELIESVEAVAGSTIEIVTTRPYRDLPALLADVTYGLAVPDTASGDTGGTGTFVSAGVRDGVLRLDVVQSRQDDTALEAVEVVEVDSIDEAVALLEAGDVDIAPLDDRQPGVTGSIVTLDAAPWQAVLNTRVAPLDDRAIRTGLLDVIADDELAGQVDGDVAGAMLAVRERAPVRVVALGGGPAEDVAATIVARLAASMIDAVVVAGDAEQVSATLRSGAWDVMVTTEVGAVAGRTLSLLDRFGSSGASNLVGIADPSIDAALGAYGAASAAEELDGRRAALRDAIEDTSVMVPVAPRLEQYLLDPRVDGVVALGELLLDAFVVQLASAT